MPQRLGFVRGRKVRGQLFVDFLGELRVVGKDSINLFSPQTEYLLRPVHAVIDGHIAADETADHFPDIGPANNHGASASRAAAEDDQRMPAQTEALLDQLLRQR